MAMHKKRKRRSTRRRRGLHGLGEVTKRDFVAIAGIICGRAPRGVAEDLAAYFAGQNPRFDRARFVKAATSCSR